MANKAAKAVPADSDALAKEGFRLYEAKKFQEAIDILNRALIIDPRNAIAYLHRGCVFHALKNYQGMVNDFNLAKNLAPDNAFLHGNIAKVLYKDKNYMSAIEPLNRAIECKPDYEEAWELLGDCYYRIGSLDSARKIFLKMREKFPNNQTDKLELAWMLGPIMASHAEIDMARAAFMENIDQLMRSGFTYTNLKEQFRYYPFYHSYHGRDVRGMQEKMAQYFYQAAPQLSYVAPHVNRPPVPGKKIRVGFVLDFLHRDVLSQFLEHLVEGIGSTGAFETTLILTSVPPGSPPLPMRGVDDILVVPHELPQASKMIAKKEFDVLVYTEIGMSIPNFLLAMTRLAPVQCNLGNHPVTSGIKNLDYFISFKDYEPENAQAYYTEKLVLLDRNIAVFKRPEIPTTVMTREQLGLPEHEHLYVCPVMLFKIHPDMDKIFARILERDPKGRIILFDSSFKTLWHARLAKRFASVLPPQLRARITFLPHAGKEHFMQILMNADAILDTVHFSFGTTAFLSFGANLPFITWPGQFSRGRTPYYLYKRMGIEDLIAKDHEDYAVLAVKLANDKAFHRAMADKIREKSDLIFDQRDMIPTLVDTLKDLYTKHMAGGA